MGEVYAATDVNLSRQVAIKVLPETVAGDADRLARFDREARTLAALNHPNIATIYGIERASGITALVLELVEGPTLADRIGEGPIPIDEALVIARQIAEALEAAHEQGIVHRDLKPANVKLRPDGRVKVLDFGLAKAIEANAALSPGLSRSPTITTPAMTQAGVILGTAAYMSPEQARGKVVDKRADIWAFGCVLYEMLTGRRVFQDDEVSDTLAYVLTREPDWTALPAGTPTAIRRLLRRCLVKDRAARLTDIGSARLEIDDARTEGPMPSAVTTSSRSTRVLIVAVGALAVLALGAVAMWIADRRQLPASLITRTSIGVAPAERLLSGFPLDPSIGQGRPSRTAMALTRDGRSIVFSAERGGHVQLYLRRLDQLEATAIAGTDGAINLFVSPMGDQVGFYADGALKRVALAGGAPVTIANVDLVYGASWGAGDEIIFATQTGGLWKVSAAGGTPTRLTKLRSDDYSHRLPHILPNGQTVLFTATRTAFPSWDDTRIVAASMTTGEQKVLVEGGADARYVRTGHLVYMRQGTLMAVPFDANRLEATGAPVGLVADVMQAAQIQPVQIDSGAGQWAASDTGSLVYVSGGTFKQDRTALVFVDRTGKSEPLNVPNGAYLGPRFSPDGKHVAFNTTSGDWDLMIYDVGRRLVTRLPMPEQQSIAVWTPDSSKLAFSSGLLTDAKLSIRSADGSGAPELLMDPGPERAGVFSPFANSWAPDGRSLVVAMRGGLWLLPYPNKTTPRQIVAPPALEADLSPDGHWLAYNGGRGAGNSQLFVQPYPALDRREGLTGEHARSPVWRRDGRELFYVDTTDPLRIRVMAVPVTTTPTFSAGTPQMLFEGPFRADGPFRGYDVSADGQRFVMVRADEQAAARVSQMVLVQNWFEELKARVPVK